MYSWSLILLFSYSIFDIIFLIELKFKLFDDKLVKLFELLWFDFSPLLECDEFKLFDKNIELDWFKQFGFVFNSNLLQKKRSINLFSFWNFFLFIKSYNSLHQSIPFLFCLSKNFNRDSFQFLFLFLELLQFCFSNPIIIIILSINWGTNFSIKIESSLILNKLNINNLI